MELLIFWIVLPVIVALIANSKGRSGLGWFLYAFLIWPVALVHILLVGRTPEGEMKKALSEGRVPCPHCKEMIKKEAHVCPHCRRDLV